MTICKSPLIDPVSQSRSVGRLEATTIGGHSPLTIDALTTFTNNITSSGETQFDGKIFVETGSINGDLHIVTNQDLMRIGKAVKRGVRVGESGSASRFVTGSDGSIIDIGFTITDESGEEVVAGDGDGIHIDSNNYWYNNRFYRVGGDPLSHNFLEYNDVSLKYRGKVIANTGSFDRDWETKVN